MIDTLKKLNFKTSKSNNNILISGTGYPIQIKIDTANLNASTIDYGQKIVVHHKGILNFKKPENLVVLECVLRLLNKGYLPSKIELEKEWKLGHRKKGRLDILLKDKKNHAFAMIECKTWGEEYLHERNNILEDGGQLFSYFIQERDAKLLILYSSQIQKDKINIQVEAIEATNLKGSNLDELHLSWNKSFVLDSIFANSATTYLSKKANITKNDLKELDRNTGQGLFNSFAEILRRNVISDKSNAFNKIFNLFVCKIYDEDTKSSNQELDFQWKTNDDFDKFLDRLITLYQKGLGDYLGIQTSKKYLSAITELSFIDVFNEETFIENARVVREVVELIQPYQLKYTSKHQFLGDFFEKLLNTSIKQEAGQFFTPTPLARFFLKSLPVEQIIQNNIDENKPHILPYILDYACGAGHFLTEAMDEVEEHFSSIDTNKLSGRTKINFESVMNNYLWAKEYVYGIEKDYRLAKTSKIALFLNGDGEATILNADGLDDFYESNKYTGKLKSNKKTKTNNQFDLIATNPPFSIAGFKRYVKNGDDNFSLYKHLSSKSSEIECLFIERMSDLLLEGGCAGIVLPLSVLNNENKVYTEARKLLLVYFDVIGIVELREKTFSATPTTTIALFLRKRSKQRIGDSLLEIRNHFLKKKKSSKITEIIKKNEVYVDINIKTVKDSLDALSTKEIKNGNYSLESLDENLSNILIHHLSNNKITVVAFSGDKKNQERFLGYRFSSSRGKEGIHYFTKNGKLDSLLYDPDDLNDSTKVNAHILANFLGSSLEIPESLNGNVSKFFTNELLTRKNHIIANPSAYFETDTYIIKSNSPFGDFIDEFKLTDHSFSQLLKKKLIKHVSGLVYKKNLDVPRKTKNRVLTASNIDLETASITYDKIIYLDEEFEIPEIMKPRKGDIVVSNSSGSLKHLGKCAYVEEDIDACIGGFLSIIRAQDEKVGKAIYYRLLSYSFRKFVASLKDQNINNLNAGELNRFKFRLPKDLNKFFKTANEKEKALKEIEKQRKKLFE